ncbi:MAG: hypothetical protein M1832_002399 [Thelocarpon impressellum]|nr:MAG: hypothetical protein M1832_002399 [Thelocarpon impressellum]
MPLPTLHISPGLPFPPPWTPTPLSPLEVLPLSEVPGNQPPSPIPGQPRPYWPTPKQQRFLCILHMHTDLSPERRAAVFNAMYRLAVSIDETCLLAVSDAIHMDVMNLWGEGWEIAAVRLLCRRLEREMRGEGVVEAREEGGVEVREEGGVEVRERGGVESRE